MKMKYLYSFLLLLCMSSMLSAQSLKKVKKDGKWGMTKAGEAVIPYEYDSLKMAGYGRIAALKGDKWGFINEENKVVAPFQFDEVESFEFSSAVITINKKKGLINLEGQLLLPITYKYLKMDKGYLIYKKRNTAGLMDTLGRRVSPIYEDIDNSFVREKISIKKDGKWGSWKAGVENMNDDYLLFSDFDLTGVLSADCIKDYKKDIILMLDAKSPTNLSNEKNKDIKTCVETSILKYLYTNIKYPVLARESGTQGLVVVSFIVKKNGDVTDIKILKNISGGCGEEVVRIVKTFPKWYQAPIRDNKLVNGVYNVPVRFRLQ